MNSILIVGAGIGGLSLAQALTKRGIPFTITEKVREPGPVGAGISLTINATRIIDALGLGEALRSAGHVYQAGHIRSDQNVTLQKTDLRPFHHYGEAVGIHRADLHALLSQGIDVHYGQAVTRVTPLTDRVRVHFGEQSQEYGLILAADGLHSRVRMSLSRAPQPVYSGYTSWRFTLHDPIGLSEPVEFWGPGLRLGLVPIGKGELYGFATRNQPPRKQALPEKHQGAELRQLFSEFPDQARTVLDTLSNDHPIIQTDINELKTHVWQQGGLAFLGDAAHGMTPNLGQGAGMGIEDALVLAESLHHYGPGPQALQVYEQVRRNRVSTVARQSRWLGLVGQLEASWAVQWRNRLMQLTPQSTIDRNVRELMITGAPQPN